MIKMNIQYIQEILNTLHINPQIVPDNNININANTNTPNVIIKDIYV